MLRETFADERVLLNLDAHDLGGVINAAVGLLVGDGLVAAAEAGRVEQALLDREAQASTAIGHAVAVPHAYHSAVLKPVIVFVRTRSPLNLGAPDGIPTRFFFFLVGPEEATSHHLDALAGVARLMADDEFRYEARHAANGAELVEALSRFTERTAPAAAPPAEEPHPTPAGLRWTGRLRGGVFDDAARRAPRYASDLIDGLHPKCLASTLLLFFACLAPAIIFGGLMAAGTGADPAAGRPGAIGPVEMLIATAVCGVAYALLSGQPLIILGG
ncbi:MAG: PTS sugar transporter subunit IIA, partial [Planctomycetota bacterium]